MKKVSCIFLMLLTAFTFSCALFSCSDDEETPATEYSSMRDGLYEGKQLEAYLDGKDITDGLSVNLQSEFAYSVPYYKEGVDTAAGNDPIYNSTVTVKGFPTYKKKITFQTKSNIRDFSGTTSINGITYDYVAEFVGHPFLRHENQGLKIWFTSK